MTEEMYLKQINEVEFLDPEFTVDAEVVCPFCERSFFSLGSDYRCCFCGGEWNVAKE